MKHTMKFLCLALAALLLTAAVCACGGGEKKTYAFSVGDVTLEPGAAVGNAIERLGAYKDHASSGSCGDFPGTDHVYVYEGFKVFTTPGKDGDIISKVELTDDSVATPEGIRIGSDETAVTGALGSGERVGGNLVYTGGTSKLTFVLRDGKVTNIVYATK